MHLLNTKKLFFTWGIIILFLLSLFGCVQPDKSGGVVTYTPSITPSPTCIPNVNLSTPEGWAVTTRLIVILYDSRPVEEYPLEFIDGEKTNDVQLFLTRTVPHLIGPGDQVVIFHTGYPSFESSRVSSLYSFTSVPQLYNTPAPRATLTPEPTVSPVPPGFEAVIATRTAMAIKADRIGTETANKSQYDCEIIYWNTNVMSTATSWNKELEKESKELAEQINENFTQHKNSVTAIKPYSTNATYYGELYLGLSYATVVFNAACKDYNECILLIIDDMATYKEEILNQLDIQLDNVNIYAIMPNCAFINEPSCVTLQTYWNSEFKRFHAGKVTYWEGINAEINLFKSEIWR